MLLGMKLDVKYSFESHISGICKKTSRQIKAQARIAPHMSLNKNHISMNAFFTPQFNYCPVIWA